MLCPILTPIPQFLCIYIIPWPAGTLSKLSFWGITTTRPSQRTLHNGENIVATVLASGPTQGNVDDVL